MLFAVMSKDDYHSSLVCHNRMLRCKATYLCGDRERDLWVTLQLFENGMTVILRSTRYLIYQDKSLSAKTLVGLSPTGCQHNHTRCQHNHYHQ